jgi:hypothetical protein
MTLSLAFLAPNLVKAALDGKLPRGFDTTRLVDLPMLWPEQWLALGLERPICTARHGLYHPGCNRNPHGGGLADTIGNAHARSFNPYRARRIRCENRTSEENRGGAYCRNARSPFVHV